MKKSKEEVIVVESADAIIPEIEFDVIRRSTVGVRLKEDSLIIKTSSPALTMDIDISISEVVNTIKKLKELK